MPSKETGPKKVKFVLVEGFSDKKSLGLALERTFPNSRVIVHYYRGDITTDPKVNHRNIEEKIWQQTKYYARQMCLKPSDFEEIIHLVDTDGAYISDRHAVSENSEKTRKKGGKENFYYDVAQGVIRAQNKQHIIDRNENKRDILDRLVECRAIHGVPYRVYYMSCNLDHVLHDKPNATDHDKERLSNQFAMRFGEDPAGFKALFTKADYCVLGDFLKSWDYIRDMYHDTRSLERHTNFGIALK